MIDDYEEVPYYSSSSSSVGSIPWADDAIKQNQLDWERVELLISGDEEPLPEETELMNEISEWRQKFPLLMEQKPSIMLKQQSFNSSITNLNSREKDNASISSLSLSSLEDFKDDDYAGLDTPNDKSNYYKKTPSQHSPKSRVQTDELTNLFHRGLYITSVPLTLRESQGKKINRTKASFGHFESNDFNMSDSSLSASSSSTYSFAPKLQLFPKSPSAKYSAKTTRSSVHMPPIINVTEVNRNNGAMPANNHSFVPLSRIHYVKSAAVRQPHQMRQTNQGAWPLASNKINYYSPNKRNAIILPAINLERINEQTIANNITSVPKRTSRELHNLSNSSQSSSGTLAGRRQSKLVNQWYSSNAVTTKTHSSAGRSISALHRPHLDSNTFYLPYSASKFKTFK